MTTMTTPRDTLIEQILDAAEASTRLHEGTPEEAFQVLGTDGKWYRAGVSSMPWGISMAKPMQRRSIGWTLRTRQGTTVGKIEPTRDALEARLKGYRDRNRTDFRTIL